jgi:hypothetical protein
MSTTAEGLQRQLEVLQRYSDNWGLAINAAKTKVVVFGQHNHCRHKVGFQVGGAEIEQVEAFTYLGTQLHATKPASTAVLTRAQKGIAAMYGVRRAMIQLGVKAPKVLLRMFDVMVEPVLSYGAENWAAKYLVPSVNDANKDLVGKDDCHKVQLRFCKILLGVSNSTSSRCVLAECGQLPLLFRWFKRTINFYNSVRREGSSTLVGAALQENIELIMMVQQHGTGVGANSWLGCIAATLQSLGVHFNPVEVPSLNTSRCCRLWKQWYIQQLSVDSSVGKYYVEHLEKELTPQNYQQLPKYLLEIPETWRRSAITQLRMGAHWLRTSCVNECQSTSGVVKKCKRCSENVDDVLRHYVFDCSYLDELRSEYSTLFESPDVPMEQFFKLDAGAVASFTTKCYQRLRI